MTQRCKIVSDGTCHGTQVFGPDGEDLSRAFRITHIAISTSRISGGVHATMTCRDVELELDGVKCHGFPSAVRAVALVRAAVRRLFGWLPRRLRSEDVAHLRDVEKRVRLRQLIDLDQLKCVVDMMAKPAKRSELPRRLPASFPDASWRGVTAFDEHIGRVGVSFDVGDITFRFALTPEDVRTLAASVEEYVSQRENVHSDNSSGNPHSSGLTPEEGKSV